MPVTYTGSDTGLNNRNDVTISNPIGTDPRNAASFTTVSEKIANYLQRLVKAAGFIDLASTWTALQTFVLANELLPHQQFGSAAPTIMRCIAAAPLAGGRFLRLYANGTSDEFSISLNAEYKTSPGPGWYADANGISVVYGLAGTALSVSRATGIAGTILTFPAASTNPKAALTLAANRVVVGEAVYWRDVGGMVHLSGAIQDSNVENLSAERLLVGIGGIPSGYRTAVHATINGASYHVSGLTGTGSQMWVEVIARPDGSVVVKPGPGGAAAGEGSSTNQWMVFLDGISWRSV